jgi:hypothetical protein
LGGLVSQQSQNGFTITGVVVTAANSTTERSQFLGRGAIEEFPIRQTTNTGNAVRRISFSVNDEQTLPFGMRSVAAFAGFL